MSLRNKVGKLSTIIRALRPENIGLIVNPIRLLGFYERGGEINLSGELYTAIISDHYWLVESPEGIETMFGGARQAYIPDTWLKPYLPKEEDKALDKALEIDKVTTS